MPWHFRQPLSSRECYGCCYVFEFLLNLYLLFSLGLCLLHRIFKSFSRWLNWRSQMFSSLLKVAVTFGPYAGAKILNKSYSHSTILKSFEIVYLTLNQNGRQIIKHVHICSVTAIRAFFYLHFVLFLFCQIILSSQKGSAHVCYFFWE